MSSQYCIRISPRPLYSPSHCTISIEDYEVDGDIIKIKEEHFC